MITRKACIDLINASHLVGRLDFAHSVAVDWLAAWPGDLEMKLLLAETEIAQRQEETAIKRLQEIIRSDPEYARAYEVLGQALAAAGNPAEGATCSACSHALRGKRPARKDAPTWVLSLSDSVKALQKNQPYQALEFARQALQIDPSLPLATHVVIKCLLASGESEAAMAMARCGLDRWPACLPFRILVAEGLIAEGQTSRGVEYLHQVAAEDTAGRIIKRLLGPNHGYQQLWPADPCTRLSRPVPAKVRAALGENRLAPASPTSTCDKEAATGISFARGRAGIPPAEEKSGSGPQPSPQPWEAFRGPDSGNSYATLDPDAFQIGEGNVAGPEDFPLPIIPARQQQEDDRRPAYLILSSRTRLNQTFGEEAFGRIDKAIDALRDSVNRRPRWIAYKVYVDDPQTLKGFDLSPVDPANAWEIKLRIADLDRALSMRGEMIAALLIVGGHQIIPFHMLPNPTDDDDEAVPSDNPYAITDDNYFAPEWPTGRFPSDNDPQLLLSMLQTATRDHIRAVRSLSLISRFRKWILNVLGRFLNGDFRSFGYSASIWRKASLAVYRVIGEPRELITSPPVEAGDLPSFVYRPIRFSYFNLHGLEDAPEWFGQRDPLRDDQAAMEFPVAVKPEDIVNSGKSPRVIFSEACYGANSLGKTSETALCLKFLRSGSRAFIGSTKISYGAVTPPLIAADLLGRDLWDYLRRSLPVGEALRQAKLHLVAEMDKRQGFLDGEDQKTLISFILYGDPLYTPQAGQRYPRHKQIVRLADRSGEIKTACALGGSSQEGDYFPRVTTQKAREIVARYLPGMADARCRINPQQCYCRGLGHTCPTHQLGAKSDAPNSGNTVVVTFAKHIPQGARRHAHFARLTMDREGRVLKLAVSR